MIFDTLDHASHYGLLSPRFKAAFDWLKRFDPNTPDGRYDVEGDDVFALVQSYETTPPSAKPYESHRKYADLQYVASGQETMLYAPLGILKVSSPYDPEGDGASYQDPEAGAVTVLPMTPGAFTIFLPQDGHKPGCVAGLPMRVKKVVMKVRVDDR